MKPGTFTRSMAALAIAGAFAFSGAGVAAAGSALGTARVAAVVLLEHPPTADDVAAVEHLGGQVGQRLEHINVLTVSLPEPALDTLARRPGVSSVEPARQDIAFHDHVTDPDDPELGWGVNRIDAEVAHSDGRDADGVVVAVVDTGIDMDHPEFTGRIDPRAKSFAGREPSDDVNDKNGHGSHTAGIVGAADDGVGVVGVAPLATLLPIQVSRGTRISDASILAAFDYLAGLEESTDGSVDVVNMSFGSSSSSAAEMTALNRLHQLGVTLVASAGNESASSPGFPAGYANVIAVSSTTADDKLSSFSNRGLTDQDLAAPGSDIYSTYKDGSYVHMSGTSMSGPHVAGAAALVVAAGSANAPNQVRATLTTTAEALGLGDGSAGLVDVARASGLDSSDNLPLGNRAPLVTAGPDQTVVLGSDAVLSEADVTDPDGDELSCTWTVRSAPAGSTSAASWSSEECGAAAFTPDLVGEYVLELTATETTTSEALSAADTVAVTALSPDASITLYGAVIAESFRNKSGRWSDVNFVVRVVTEDGAPVVGAVVTADIWRDGKTFAGLVQTTGTDGRAAFKISRALDVAYTIGVTSVTENYPLLVWDAIRAQATNTP